PDDDLEVHGLALSHWPARCPLRPHRAVTDLGNTTDERAAGERIDGDLRAVAQLDVRDIGFIDADDGLHEPQVADREQQAAGVVHRTDDRGLSLLHGKAGDDAIDRSADDRLGEAVFGFAERGARLRHTVARRLGELRLDPGLRFRFLERLLTDEVGVLRPERAGALEHPFRLEEVGARLRLPGQCLADAGLRARDGGFVLRRVDAQQDLAPLHGFAFGDVQLDDAPHDVRLHVDRAVWANPAAARDDGGQVATRDGLDADLYAAPARALREEGADEARHDDGASDDADRAQSHRPGSWFCSRGAPAPSLAGSAPLSSGSGSGLGASSCLRRWPLACSSPASASWKP